MVSNAVVYTACACTASAALIALGFSCKVVIRFLLQLPRQRIFVNFFYVVTFLLLLTDIVGCVAIIVSKPDYEDVITVNDTITTNIFTVLNALHEIFYLSLIMLMIVSLIQVSMGLKILFL